MREIIFLNEDAVTRKTRELKQKKDQAGSDEEKNAIQAQIDRIDPTGEGQLRVATGIRNNKDIKKIKSGEVQGDRAIQSQDRMNARSLDARLEKDETNNGRSWLYSSDSSAGWHAPVKRSDDERLATNKRTADVIERDKERPPYFDSSYRDYTSEHGYDMHDSSRHIDRKAKDAEDADEKTRKLHSDAAFIHNSAIWDARKAGEKTGTITYKTKNGKVIKTRKVDANGPFVSGDMIEGGPYEKGKLTYY